MFFRSFIPSFVCLFVRLFVRSFVCSFVCSFVRSFVRSVQFSLVLLFFPVNNSEERNPLKTVKLSLPALSLFIFSFIFISFLFSFSRCLLCTVSVYSSLFLFFAHFLFFFCSFSTKMQLNIVTTHSTEFGFRCNFLVFGFRTHVPQNE